MKTQEKTNADFVGKLESQETFGFMDRIVHDTKGFSLVELIVVVAILGILATMALPMFSALKAKAQISRSALEIRSLEKDVIAFSTDAARYPNDLREIHRDKLLDPWGSGYVYFPIPASHAGAYTEYGGGWLNDDFDLYSMGVDRDTDHNIVSPPLINKSSDDIIRGGSGATVELGSQW